jgi:hypothetical protein
MEVACSLVVLSVLITHAAIAAEQGHYDLSADAVIRSRAHATT